MKNTYLILKKCLSKIGDTNPKLLELVESPYFMSRVTGAFER
jgi:hypothetical protein